jgi:DNA-directed RNA polymerase beta subunit
MVTTLKTRFLISERIVKKTFLLRYTLMNSKVGARDTKLGPEEITRDIPNLGDEALKKLGPDGVIRVGAEVKPGDILGWEDHTEKRNGTGALKNGCFVPSSVKKPRM